MRSSLVITLLWCWLLARPTFAAEVDIAISAAEAYVEQPVMLQIRISDASTHQAPELPEVDGLRIEPLGAPSRSSQISILQGQRSVRSSVTYQYRVTPTREGDFTIPPIKISADNLSTITKAVRLVANKSETGDLMFVEVSGAKSEIFVGEALQLTLKLWIRPYRDREHRITLSESDMWQLLSKQTDWGVFSERMQQLANNRKRPGGRQVLRDDSSGQQRGYLLYEISTTIYPTKPDTIDASDIRVVVDYPTALGRSRSPLDSFFGDDNFPFGGSLFDDDSLPGFGSRLAVTSTRPIVAAANVEPITVKPVPMQGRPADYRGAVGQYSIAVEAGPTRVKVGDPITLQIGIEGTGPMDRVRAPALGEQTALTDAFKVPDESLAGFVDGSTKLFTTTIRARRAGVTEIPPISLSYFDPVQEKFVTTSSEPIRIEVDPADVLALDTIVADRNPAPLDRSAADTTGSEPAAGWTIYPAASLLTPVPPATLVPPLAWVLLAIAPAVALITAFLRHPQFWFKLLGERGQLRRRLQRADTSDDVADALQRFLAAKFRIDSDKSLRDLTIGGLRKRGLNELAIQTERFYTHCERWLDDAVELQSLRDEAWRIATEVQQARSPSRALPMLRQTSAGALLLICSGQPMANAAAPSTPIAASLTPAQQRQLAQEAIELLQSAADQPSPSDQARQAAQRLQSVVDSGVRNDRLYFQLSIAQTHAGQPAMAVANVRRALRLDPHNTTYRDHLNRLQHQSNLQPDTRESAWNRVTLLHEALLRWVTPQTMGIASLVGWFGLWSMIILRLAGVVTHWKSVAAMSLLVTLLCGGSYGLATAPLLRSDTAVLVADAVEVRQGDGHEFPIVTRLDSAAGRLVQVLGQRPGWIRIALPSGHSGWVASEAMERI